LQGPQEDTEPKAFFEQSLSTTQFQERVEKWCEDLPTLWLASKWIEERSTEEEVPGDVWIGSETGDDDEFYMSAFDPSIQWPFDVRKYPLNRNHPWVKKKFESMPKFRPMIMFRQCSWPCEIP
jgi:hypothetical protein